MRHSPTLDRLARAALGALMFAIVLAASAAVPGGHADAQLVKKVKSKVTRAAGGGADLRSSTAAAAESTATGTRDTLRGADSAAKKAGRMATLGRVAAKANQAATAIERETGISKETMAKAALAGTGVGAAAMLARPANASGKGKVAQAVGNVLSSGAQGAPPSAATAAAAAAAVMSGRSPAAAMGMTPGAMAMMAGAGMPRGMDPEFIKLQQEISQLAMRASAGDPGAQRQFMRFQAELMHASAALAAVPPADQMSAAIALQRQALRCAATGSGCKAAP